MTQTLPSDLNSLIKRMYHHSSVDQQIKELATDSPTIRDALIAALDDSTLTFQKRSIVEILGVLGELRAEQAIRRCHADAQAPRHPALKTAAALALVSLTGDALPSLLTGDEISRHIMKEIMDGNAEFDARRRALTHRD